MYMYSNCVYGGHLYIYSFKWSYSMHSYEIACFTCIIYAFTLSTTVVAVIRAGAVLLLSLWLSFQES